MTKRYEVFEPPTVGELDRLLGSLGLLNVNLPLTVAEQPDELSRRREGCDGPKRNKQELDLLVVSTHSGVSDEPGQESKPYVLGYIGSEPEKFARLSVAAATELTGDERPLELTVLE